MYHRLRDAALLELQFLREHHNGEVALLLSRLEQAKLAAQVRLWSVPCDGLFVFHVVFTGPGEGHNDFRSPRASQVVE
jgi:hypothetical protein